MSRRRVAASAATLCLVLAVGRWSVVASPVQPAANGLLQAAPGPLEQRAQAVTPDNPIPRALHIEPAAFPNVVDADRSSARITVRTVVDEAGAVAEVRIAGFSVKLDDSIAAMDGPESLARLDEALAKLTSRQSATTPGLSASTLRPLLDAFFDSAATAVRLSRYEPPPGGPIVFNTIVQFTAGQPLATSRTAPVTERVSADGTVRVGGGIQPPVKVKDVRPVYPQDARDAGVQGVVVIDIRIEPDGRVGSAKVLRSVPMLDQAALDAVRQWEFTPTLLNGVPVPVMMTVTVQLTVR